MTPFKFIPKFLRLPKEDRNNFRVERGKRPRDAPSRQCYLTGNELPPELLSHVFQFGIAHQTDSDLADSNAIAYVPVSGRPRQVPASFMSIVSQVCYYWHDVAIATPSLWTSITITLPTPDHRIAYFLERTKDLPIDIDCTILSSGTYGLLLAHVHRWRSMKMKFSTSHSMEEFLEAASQPSILSAAQLTTLQLQVDMYARPSRGVYDTYPFFTPFGGVAPRLERITFWGVHVDWNQDWISSAPNLTHLDLGFHMDEPGIPWPQLLNILRGSPKLKKLGLHFLDPWGPQFGKPLDTTLDGPIQLLDLTDLVIVDLPTSCYPHLLRNLYIPALKSLGLNFVYGDIRNFANISVTGPSPDAQPRTLLSGLESSSPCCPIEREPSRPSTESFGTSNHYSFPLLTSPASSSLVSLARWRNTVSGYLASKLSTSQRRTYATHISSERCSKSERG